jgi:hypothetical protein
MWKEEMWRKYRKKECRKNVKKWKGCEREDVERNVKKI